MSNNFHKTLFIILFFTVFLGVLFAPRIVNLAKQNESGDTINHFSKIIGQCEVATNKENCEAYPVGYYLVPILINLDSYRGFWLYNLFLFSVLFPLILFYLTRNKWVVLFFFIGTQIPYYIIGSGAYPMGFTMMFWLFLVYSKNTKLEIFLVASSFFLHNSAPLLFFTTYIWKYFPMIKERFKARVKSLITWPYFYLSSIWNTLAQNNIHTTLYFIFSTVLPVIPILAFHRFLKEKNTFLAGIVVMTIIFSFSTPRVWLFGVLVLLIEFGKIYEKLPLRTKKLIIYLILIYWLITVGVNYWSYAPHTDLDIFIEWLKGIAKSRFYYLTNLI